MAKSAGPYRVIPAGSAVIQGQGWQKQWGFEHRIAPPCRFEFNHHRLEFLRHSKSVLPEVGDW